MQKQIQARKPPAGTVLFSIYLPLDTHKALKVWAAMEGTTCKGIILKSLQMYFADEKIHKKVLNKDEL